MRRPTCENVVTGGRPGTGAPLTNTIAGNKTILTFSTSAVCCDGARIIFKYVPLDLFGARAPWQALQALASVESLLAGARAALLPATTIFLISMRLKNLRFAAGFDVKSLYSVFENKYQISMEDMSLFHSLVFEVGSRGKKTHI